MGRKSTPVKTPAGIANLTPEGRRGAAPREEREPATIGTLGARGPPDVLDDPLMFLPEVEKATRLSATTIWRREAAGKFPPRHRHGKYAVWFRSEIIRYMESLRADVGGPASAPTKANEARRRAARHRRDALAA